MSASELKMQADIADTRSEFHCFAHHKSYRQLAKDTNKQTFSGYFLMLPLRMPQSFNRYFNAIIVGGWFFFVCVGDEPEAEFHC